MARQFKMAAWLASLIVVVCLLSLQANGRLTMERNYVREGLPTDDEDDNPDADPLDSIFNEEKFYEYSPDKSASHVGNRSISSVNSTRHSSAMSPGLVVSPTVSLALLDNQSHPTYTLANSSVAAASSTPTLANLTSHSLSPSSVSALIHTVNVSESSAILLVNSTVSTSAFRGDALSIAFTHSSILPTFSRNFSTDATVSISNSSNNNNNISRSSSNNTHFATNPSLHTNASSETAWHNSSVSANTSLSHAPSSPSSSPAILSTPSSYMPSVSSSPDPLHGGPRVYPLSNGLLSWEDDRPFHTEPLGTAQSHAATSPHTTEELPLITDNHQGVGSLSHSPVPLPGQDLGHKSTVLLYSGIVLPIVSGVLGAVVIAFAILMCRCCRRRRLKKVRYFGGKPNSDFVRLDRMNLLSDSSDED